MEDITKHYLISGRVQGVGFRAYTMRAAGELGLRGWVRNLHDRRVEALATGSGEILELFTAKLKAGPAQSQVEAVVVSAWMSSASASVLGEFEVRKDGVKPCCED